MKEILKKIFSKEVLIALLLINTVLHYLNFRFEEIDLPNQTKKLVIDTIKNEISFNAKCVHENCKKEVRNLENVLDEISYANQLGRLDMISLLLALFALVLGFRAVYGFMYIKETSEAIARDVARETAEKHTLEFLQRWSEIQDKKEVSEDKKIRPKKQKGQKTRLGTIV